MRHLTSGRSGRAVEQRVSSERRVRPAAQPQVVDMARTYEMIERAKLVFLCGKMAAGKSTLARKLAREYDAVLLVQDEFLVKLFPGEIVDIPGFVKYSSRLKDALAGHICSLLSRGVSVVLDFPGNTKAQRAWFRELFEC